MHPHSPELAWIDSQRDRMLRLVTDWSRINSGTHNLPGIERCAQAISIEFAMLGSPITRVPLAPEQIVSAAGRISSRPLAPAIRIIKPAQAAGALRVLLCIHIDTVYPADHPFQQVTRLDDNTLSGPAVADAKGGVAVMLIALEALQRSRLADRIAWEVLLNTDEEIGSAGSIDALHESAARNDLGLLFEPALPDGSLIGDRKGSGNFTAVFTGRSAHAGRAVHEGRNAITAMAEFIVAAAGNFGDLPPGVTINVGCVEGGGPVNVVPDLAVARFNIRVENAPQQQAVEDKLRQWAAAFNTREGFSMKLHGGFTSPPRPVTGKTLELFEHVAACGRELRLDLRWQPSGGVSDGNKLAAAGLPNVDNLGVRGGQIHSPHEFMRISSLTERAKLTAMLLLKLAAGEITWPRKD